MHRAAAVRRVACTALPASWRAPGCRALRLRQQSSSSVVPQQQKRAHAVTCGSSGSAWARPPCRAARSLFSASLVATVRPHTANTALAATRSSHHAVRHASGKSAADEDELDSLGSKADEEDPGHPLAALPRAHSLFASLLGHVKPANDELRRRQQQQQQQQAAAGSTVAPSTAVTPTPTPPLEAPTPISDATACGLLDELARADKHSEQVLVYRADEAPFRAPDTTFSGLDIVFLGTASCSPTIERNVSSIALKLEGETWLFDAGEGTQRQLALCRTCDLSSSRLSRIFISHMHGDHVFGLLPVILSFLNRTKDMPLEDQVELHIYGPVGLRSFVFACLEATESKVNRGRVQVHELCPSLPSNGIVNPLDIYPTEDSHNNLLYWNVCSDGKRHVVSAPLNHTVPCWGYVVQEAARAGTLNVEKLTALGVPPGPVYRSLKHGNDLKLPSGETIFAHDVVGPQRRGRKIAILGDSSDSMAMLPMAANADVLIHEATFTANEPESYAKSRGHSNVRMAAQFAHAANAKTLVLTHFGGAMQSQPTALSEQAIRQHYSGELFFAEDFMCVRVPRPEGAVVPSAASDAATSSSSSSN